VSRRRHIALLAAAALALFWPAMADDRHRAAERALEEGEARPIEEVLARVGATFPGRVLKVELERRRDRAWAYEVKLLTPEGDVLELEYDAATLELLKLEGRYRGREDD
jgi:uncharacterized membrane protein YkoI